MLNRFMYIIRMHMHLHCTYVYAPVEYTRPLLQSSLCQILFQTFISTDFLKGAQPLWVRTNHLHVQNLHALQTRSYNVDDSLHTCVVVEST